MCLLWVKSRFLYLGYSGPLQGFFPEGKDRTSGPWSNFLFIWERKTKREEKTLESIRAEQWRKLCKKRNLIITLSASYWEVNKNVQHIEFGWRRQFWHVLYNPSLFPFLSFFQKTESKPLYFFQMRSQFLKSKFKKGHASWTFLKTRVGSRKLLLQVAGFVNIMSEIQHIKIPTPQCCNSFMQIGN